VTVNSKEENSKDFFLDFVQEFGLRRTVNMRRVEPITRRGAKKTSTNQEQGAIV
jgi:hypothetical protein